jgi:hypothetical protein
MNRPPHQIPSNFAAAIQHAAERRSVPPKGAGFVQESIVSRVAQGMESLRMLLPYPPACDQCRDRPGQLISSVILAFVEGNLKPGDPFPEPAELARACHMPLHEVLAANAFLMDQKILRQDGAGSLRIHPKAIPTLDMKQHAFLVRARQLVGQARQWHLPPEGLCVLFDKANREPP